MVPGDAGGKNMRATSVQIQITSDFNMAPLACELKVPEILEFKFKGEAKDLYTGAIILTACWMVGYYFYKRLNRD
jgi:hypothetical protein